MSVQLTCDKSDLRSKWYSAVLTLRERMLFPLGVRLRPIAPLAVPSPYACRGISPSSECSESEDRLPFLYKCRLLARLTFEARDEED